MQDSVFDAWQQRIEPRARYWMEVLGLQQWEWVLSYDRENNVPNLSYMPPDGGTTTASVSASWAYQRFEVTFHLVGLQRLEDAGRLSPRLLDNIVVHELLHAVLDELQEGVSQKRLAAWHAHEERVVSVLAGAFSMQEAMHRDKEEALREWARRTEVELYGYRRRAAKRKDRKQQRKAARRERRGE